MIRVLSWNVRGGLGLDGRRDTARTAQAVLAHAPDIVCLQEVHQRLPWSGFIDQPGIFRKELGMRVVFQRNVNTVIGGYGVAVAARLPLLRARRHFLPSVGERRGALETVWETPDGPLSVWCTHWGLRGEERVRQAARLAALLAASRAPVVVCGDCNERADAPALRRLRAEAGLGDAGAAGDLPTYPADVPAARIDFLLHSPGLTAHRAFVPDTQVSDHRPVIGDFGAVSEGGQRPFLP